MQRKRSLILFVAAFTAAFAFLIAAAPLFATSKEQVLHDFANDGMDGYYPSAGLTFDAAGNLYGTTLGGGAHNGGAVFQLIPGENDTWTETVLYSFCSATKCADGEGPLASLIFDGAGNLYGTTAGGGAHGTQCSGGCGTVFQLAPGANGTWTETVLHRFHDNGKDGFDPWASLIFDAAGNLYGTTVLGGSHNGGTVFQLARGTDGKWTEKVRHNFGKGTDGYGPYGGLIFDATGNLYGTTFEGGTRRGGTVFQMVPGTNGGWTEKKLHSFNAGNYPEAGLIFDTADENLYGTTLQGHGLGSVFQLARGTDGKWTEKAIHTFTGPDGSYPQAGVIFDKAGNLYSTTGHGGAYGGTDGYGTVFKLTPGAGGIWTETVLYSFTGGSDGANPYAGLIFNADGNLYGTTGNGGVSNDGTVFEITP